MFRKVLLQYVNPQGRLPEIAGTKTGKLLIIGSAVGVWNDLERYDHIHGISDRMAINDMMAYYPGRLDYGVTIHTDKLPGWVFNQSYWAPKKNWKPMECHGRFKSPHVKYQWPLKRDGGTSGLFAVLVGLLLGYDEIILAGVPCDGSPRFCDPPAKNHQQFIKESVHQEWMRARDAVFNGRIKSLSGNTALWLGEPDIPHEATSQPINFIENCVIVDRAVTVITPTGDRPEALFLLRQWMAKQTLPPSQWLIIDDGKTPTGKIHEAEVIRREPQPDDSPCTIGENLQAAFPHVRNNKILIMEDDDWYAPAYIETMAALLDSHELVGIWGTKYWHVGVPGYRVMGQNGHASLSQTGFKKSVIPQIINAIPGDCSIDLRLWWGGERRIKGNTVGHLLPGAGKKLHCGIKGLPGRAGAGVGHVPAHYTEDLDCTMLKEWCDNWETYQKPFGVKNRLVIYTAVAGNGDRDRLRDPEPIPGVDYVCFTDQPFQSEVWDIKPFSWNHKDPCRVAKHPKVLPHRYFPNHDLSVWIDGNIIPGPEILETTLKHLSQFHLAIHRHPQRKCLYREAEHLIGKIKESPELIEKTVLRYLMAKMPHNWGLFEGGINFRRHHEDAVKEAMEMWWSEIKKGCNRDQIPLPYTLWKTALPFGVIEMNLRENTCLTFNNHVEILWGTKREDEIACNLPH